jgi:hypothetical protein
MLEGSCTCIGCRHGVSMDLGVLCTALATQPYSCNESLLSLRQRRITAGFQGVEVAKRDSAWGQTIRNSLYQALKKGPQRIKHSKVMKVNWDMLLQDVTFPEQCNDRSTNLMRDKWSSNITKTFQWNSSLQDKKRFTDKEVVVLKLEHETSFTWDQSWEKCMVLRQALERKKPTFFVCLHSVGVYLFISKLHS